MSLCSPVLKVGGSLAHVVRRFSELRDALMTHHPYLTFYTCRKEIYRDRRENWIDDELVETQHELDQASSRYEMVPKLDVHRIEPHFSVC